MVGVIGSLYLTRRGQKQDAEIAGAAASRTEAAARLTEEYTRRIVDALELLASGTAQVSAPAVRWSLDHHSGSTYFLTNTGTTTALEVKVEADETLPLRLEFDDAATVRPGEALAFMAVASLATRDRTVTVTWTEEPGGDLQTWRYPLPM